MFGYLYARLKFGWTTLQYSAYLSVSSAFTAFGIIIVLPLLIRYKSQKASPPVLQHTVGGFLLMKKPYPILSFSLGFHDSTLGVMGASSTLLSYLAIAFAQSGEWMYMGLQISL